VKLDFPSFGAIGTFDFFLHTIRGKSHQTVVLFNVRSIS
jgi:hypothetical protein